MSLLQCCENRTPKQQTRLLKKRLGAIVWNINMLISEGWLMVTFYLVHFLSSLHFTILWNWAQYSVSKSCPPLKGRQAPVGNRLIFGQGQKTCGRRTWGSVLDQEVRGGSEREGAPWIGSSSWNTDIVMRVLGK